MDQSDLYDAIDRLGTVAVTTRAYRHISPSRDCLGAEGARRNGGRWNPKNSFPVLYTALTLGVAAAELARLAARQGRTASDFLPRRVCHLDTDLSSVVDLRTATNLESVGLTFSSVTSDNMEKCQAVGAAAHQLGIEGIWAPSATGTGENLVIFVLNIQPQSGLSVVATTQWDVASELPR